MTIKQFIEKATKGGWKPIWTSLSPEQLPFELSKSPEYFCQILLDPLAWQAVERITGSTDSESTIKKASLYQMHQMIDALAEGKTIEELLETLD